MQIGLVGGALLVFLGVVLLFFIAMGTFAEVGVGSFSGQGMLPVTIPGEENVVQINCSWGPTTGFYLSALSVLVMVFLLIFTLRKRNKKTQ